MDTFETQLQLFLDKYQSQKDVFNVLVHMALVYYDIKLGAYADSSMKGILDELNNLVDRPFQIDVINKISLWIQKKPALPLPVDKTSIKEYLGLYQSDSHSPIFKTYSAKIHLQFKRKKFREFHIETYNLHQIQIHEFHTFIAEQVQEWNKVLLQFDLRCNYSFHLNPSYYDYIEFLKTSNMDMILKYWKNIRHILNTEGEDSINQSTISDTFPKIIQIVTAHISKIEAERNTVDAPVLSSDTLVITPSLYPWNSLHPSISNEWTSNGVQYPSGTHSIYLRFLERFNISNEIVDKLLRLKSIEEPVEILFKTRLDQQIEEWFKIAYLHIFKTKTNQPVYRKPDKVVDEWVKIAKRAYSSISSSVAFDNYHPFIPFESLRIDGIQFKYIAEYIYYQLFLMMNIKNALKTIRSFRTQPMKQLYLEYKMLFDTFVYSLTYRLTMEYLDSKWRTDPVFQTTVRVIPSFVLKGKGFLSFQIQDTIQKFVETKSQPIQSLFPVDTRKIYTSFSKEWGLLRVKGFIETLLCIHRVTRQPLRLTLIDRVIKSFYSVCPCDYEKLFILPCPDTFSSDIREIVPVSQYDMIESEECMYGIWKYLSGLYYMIAQHFENTQKRMTRTRLKQYIVECQKVPDTFEKQDIYIAVRSILNGLRTIQNEYIFDLKFVNEILKLTEIQPTELRVVDQEFYHRIYTDLESMLKTNPNIRQYSNEVYLYVETLARMKLSEETRSRIYFYS